MNLLKNVSIICRVLYYVYFCLISLQVLMMQYKIYVIIYIMSSCHLVSHCVLFVKWGIQYCERIMLRDQAFTEHCACIVLCVFYDNAGMMQVWCVHPARIFHSYMIRNAHQMIGNAHLMRVDRQCAFMCTHFRRTRRCACNIMYSQYCSIPIVYMARNLVSGDTVPKLNPNFRVPLAWCNIFGSENHYYGLFIIVYNIVSSVCQTKCSFLGKTATP
jgi:hypothetical protein